jgi:hypothetical protein
MFKLPKPVDENGNTYTAIDVYNLCISGVKKPKFFKVELEGIRTDVENEALLYETAASSNRLHTILRKQALGTVGKAKLLRLYIYRMLDFDQPGRKVYDQIYNSTKHKKCPLCGIGTVTSLDHHLPKTLYPALCVMPYNLIPACDWCQGEKATKYPSNAAEETLHPYYDDFENDNWLKAKVIEGNPYTIEYFVDVPAGWDPINASRLGHHLISFNLTELYSLNAGSQLAGFQDKHIKLHAALGASGVRDSLLEDMMSWLKVSKNSWAAAMYKAAAESDWFCDGGFEYI